MHSENHYLDEMFLKNLMFDDFKAKSWSDAKDQDDLERAKESAKIEDGAFDAATDFANCWIDAYYADTGFDNGLLTFEIKEWGDDGPDSQYFEIEFKLDSKPFQTVYLNFLKRADGKWGIVEAIANA